LVRRLSNTFVFDVYDSVRNLPGSTQARELIVRTGLQYLDDLSGNASGDVGLQRELAAAYRRIGDVQGDVMGANLGNTANALASYGKALALLESVLREDPSDRPSAIEQVTLHQRIGGIRAYTKDPAQARASYRRAEGLAEPILARFPDDEQIARQLAEVYNASADVLRRQGDYPASSQEFNKARVLLERFENSHPDDRELKRALATAYSGVGQCDARLGRLKDGLAWQRKAVARLETIARLDLANISYQRELMFTYAHVGDLLGNPNLRNLGDTAGAVKAYRRMAEVARHLHRSDPADQRARSDYGIALLRVAAVMPGQAAESIKILLQAIQLLQEVARASPDNLISRAEMAFGHNFLGDAYQSAGDEESAMGAFRDGLTLLDELLATGSGTVITASLLMCRKLGELTAKRGDREASVALARRAMQLADPNHPAAKGRPAAVQRMLLPRAYATTGFVYATLARTGHRRPADRADARNWLEKSLREFRELERLPTFNDLHRQEMRAIEKSLEAVR
jgi:tetratricopeptide (TPR) repeat protein